MTPPAFTRVPFALKFRQTANHAAAPARGVRNRDEVDGATARREESGPLTSRRQAHHAALAGALALVLSGCTGVATVAVAERVEVEFASRTGTTGKDAAQILKTDKFATDQPVVLQQIGVHHAHAMGLTGRGVRIGIDDDFVDYTQREEFDGRVERGASAGARLADDGGTLDDDIHEAIEECREKETCARLIESETVGTKYAIRLESAHDWIRVEYDSGGEKGIANAVVEELVGVGLHELPNMLYEYGRIEHILLHDTHRAETDTAVDEARRRATTPNIYTSTHGTAVASVAAGTRLGVAPAATIVPTARNLTDYDWLVPGIVPVEAKTAIKEMNDGVRRLTDWRLAHEQQAIYDDADVINRSWGHVLGTRTISAAEIDEQRQWYKRHLPALLRAYLQEGTSPERKTIVVYAAGNSGHRGRDRPAGEAQLPYHVEELRGHTLAVVATDPETGRIADYSNTCGPLPSGWNRVIHGDHYCLAAPGRMQVRVPDRHRPGDGPPHEARGTSFAAPLVSGAIALMKEHFRYTMGNTAIVRRMLDTARKDGVYADARTYGAGHLDLEAALSPRGPLRAGPDAHPLDATTLVAPSAYGALGQRVDAELAAFDAEGFPFWFSLEERITTRAARPKPIPVVDQAPETGAPEIDGARWTAIGRARVQTETPLWVFGAGEGTAGMGRMPTSRHWGYGLAASNDGAIASRGEGAFDAGTHTGLLWASGAAHAIIGAGIAVNATATLAASANAHERRAMFETSPVLMSALAVRAGNERTSLTIEQPLRAETGTGVFHLDTGHSEDGRRLRDTYRVRLEPEGREVRATLRHEVTGRSWKIAVEATATVDAGHVPSERDVSIGAVYRRQW